MNIGKGEATGIGISFVIALLTIWIVAVAIDGCMRRGGTQAGTAAKSAFLDAGVSIEAPSPSKPSFTYHEGHNTGYGWGKNNLSFIVSGEEVFRVDETGLITGEGGRTIGRLNKRERKLFMTAIGR